MRQASPTPHRFPVCRAVCAVLLCALAACEEFPELDGTVPAHMKEAGFPTLVPVEPLVTAARAPAITETTMAGMAARVAALRTRAARLSGPVVDRATKARMARGISDTRDESVLPKT